MNHISNFYIFGIDPGTNTGVSIYELTEEFEIVSIHTHTLTLNDYVDIDSNSLAKDVDRYLALGSLIKELLTRYRPKAIAYESSFINVRFMKAGMSVMGYISVIAYVIKEFDKDIVICRLAPKSIKKFMGNASANKDNMKDLVHNNIRKFIKIEEQTEHSIDAIAIGYNMVDILKSTPYLLR